MKLLWEPEIHWESKVQEALSVLDGALECFSPKEAFACFSGGVDSTVSTKIASLHPKVGRGLLIDTQTGVKEGQEYVEAQCKAWGLDLEIRRSHVDFIDLAKRFGILGAGHHATYFNNLKGRVFRQVGYDYAETTKDRVLLISGVRSQESARRKKNVVPFKQDAFETRLTWASPIHDWSKLECREYMRHEGIEENPVSAVLHRSGECNCPAFMSKDEFAELEFWFPDAVKPLYAAMEAAKEAGKWHKYGEPVPDWFNHPEQGALDQFLQDPGCETIACSDCPQRKVAVDAPSNQPESSQEPSA